jgi:type I site-specific restriction endonuclease
MKLTGIITKRGFEVSKTKIIEKYNEKIYKKILKKFIIRYKSPIGTFFIEKKNYKIDGDIVLFPRFGASDLLNSKLVDSIENLIQEGKPINITYTGTPTYNQEVIIEHIFKNIYNEENKKQGSCGLTLNMIAGGGKTFLAMNIISRLKVKTLIVVPNTYLLTQWVELLEEFFPNNTIGQYYGKVKEDGDIVVAIINSLINDDFTFTSTTVTEIEEIKKGKTKIKIKKEKSIITKSYKEYFKEFGFVILDESHIYCTDSFKVVYNRFQSTYMLGLSATPNERTNNCDIISHLNIGKVLIAGDIEKYQNDTTTFSAMVSIVKYNGPDKYTNIHINEKLQLICVPKIIEDLINDEFRNKLILDELYKLFDLQLNIFVFSERRSHLEHLYEQFNYFLDDKDINKDIIEKNISIPELDINKNIVLYGNSSDEDINTAKTNSNVIFTTFSYSSTGVSINRMTAMVLATPRRSKATQIIGRIFRLNKENNHIKRIIVDIIDNKTVLKNQFHERKKAYKERNAEITTNVVNYTDIKF